MADPEQPTPSVPDDPFEIEEVPGTPLQRFSNWRIQEKVDAALSTIPDGKHGAFLALATPEGVRTVAAARLSEGWSIGLAAEKKWAQPGLDIEVGVRFTW